MKFENLTLLLQKNGFRYQGHTNLWLGNVPRCVDLIRERQLDGELLELWWKYEYDSIDNIVVGIWHKGQHVIDYGEDAVDLYEVRILKKGVIKSIFRLSEIDIIQWIKTEIHETI